MEKRTDLQVTQKQLDHLAWLLDNCFRIPGTKWRFGLETLIGLIPGAGDIVSGGLGFFLLVGAFQFKLPKVVIARMLANHLLDFTIGAIPLLGDVFDMFFKSNMRNMQLFHEFASEPAKDTRKHWIFFALILSGSVLIFLLVVALVIYILINGFQFLQQGGSGR